MCIEFNAKQLKSVIFMQASLKGGPPIFFNNFSLKGKVGNPPPPKKKNNNNNNEMQITN